MKADVYVLRDANGKPLPPAVQASVLAKFSRSPESAREILKDMTPQMAEAFQEKWGVTFGHSSVAELADMPYCFEGVSIIASKQIEAYQRGAYSEKSTRYQVFNRDSFVEPPGADSRIRQAADVLYHAYEKLTTPVYQYVRSLMPDGTPESIIKARAFDSLRYLLPAGTGTNVAAVLNARDARYMMSDFLGSKNTELSGLGERMMSAARDVAPVFAMGVKENSFEPPIRELEAGTAGIGPRVTLLDGGDHIRRANMFWRKVFMRYGMTKDEFARFMETRGKRQVPSVFKTIVVTFDIVMDYGAYRDLQRHRRCEQYPEFLTTKYGYDTPDDILSTEFENTYQDAMERNRVIVETLSNTGVPTWMLQYALPLGTLFRCQFQMDLRELYYIVELRTQPQGHISYRRIAYEMFQRAVEAFPHLMRWCNAIQPTRVEAHK